MKKTLTFCILILCILLIGAPFGAALAAATEAPAAVEGSSSLLFWLLLGLLGLCALLAVGISLLSKRRRQRIMLWLLALILLASGGFLLTRNRPQTAQAAPPTASPVPTPPPTPAATPAIYELSFTTDTLPEPTALADYPALQALDITACEQVDAALYEAIRQAVPADCRIRWSVPLTDGRFPSDSTSLTLPNLSPSDAALLSCFEALSALDASGSTAWDALLDLKEDRPDLALTFTLPVGDRVLTMGDEALEVKEVPDFALLQKMLGAFPALTTLDMTQAHVDPADAAALSALFPEKNVLYLVPIGSGRFSPDAESIALEGSGIRTPEELLNSLSYLPAVRSIDLHGTVLGLDDLTAILSARPDLALSQQVELLGEAVETDAEELDLRNAAVSGEELLQLLRPFGALQRVYLPQSKDVEATAALLRTEHPETRFVYKVTAFGRTLESTTEELDVSRTLFSSPEKVKAELAHLPYLKKLVMLSCGLTNEQMEELLTAYPQIKFVWLLRLGPHLVRTDAVGFSTQNPSKQTSSSFSDEYNQWVRTVQRLRPGDLAPLKYFTDLIALDLGHNYLTSEDLEMLRYVPHLQVLILADNQITDISVLHELKELRYVELFMNHIPDMSPLVGLENLTDINIANTHLEDITPLLSLTQAKRLWFAMNGLTPEQNQAVVDALPDCVCNYTTTDETSEGWREGEVYQWMRDFFTNR